MKKLSGACLMKQTEKNYKEKSCKQCGEYFKPKYPDEKYCSNKCREMSRATMYKALYSLKYGKHKRKVEEYNRTHRFCPLCGEPITDGRQKVHFDCMVQKWREGDRTKWVRKFFENRGYRVREVNELAKRSE